MNEFLINRILDPATNGPNIGHFFNEYLFWALESYFYDPSITWVLGTTLYEWEHKYALLLIKHLNINYRYQELGDYRKMPIIFDINKSPIFNKIILFIKDIIRKEFPETEPPSKVLYFRNDAPRRKMAGYSGSIDHLFDKVITDMASLSFEDQVRLFMNCSHLVTIEGAHLTNINFMNENAKVLDITPFPNSWQVKYEESKFISYFEEFSMSLADFNSNIEYSTEIEEKIKAFLMI
jgi:hypothetical protein